MIESIKICDDLNNENQYLCLQLNCLNQIKCHKNHFSYVKLILLLSWDITLNTGSIQSNHLKENWDIFRNRDLHFIHLNINSLLPNIDELREIVKISNPTVIGITETKLDNSICDSEIPIDGYCAIRGDRNRKGGGVICYVNNKICYNTKNCISNETENIFLELLIPETRPVTVGIVYESPDKSRFLEILSNSLNSLNMLSEEWHILGDLNINLYHIGSSLGEENKNIIKAANKVSFETNKYLEFCKTFGLKEWIESPIRVTANTSTLIDQILKNTNERITQCGIINIGSSDHQMIFCTRKIKKDKVVGYKQISFRSFKNYSVDEYEKALGKVTFPNYDKIII